MFPKLPLSVIALSVSLLAMAGCAEKTLPPVDTAQPRLDETRFRALGLEIYWPNDLVLAPNERLSRVWLAKDSVYCLTSSNMLHRLDRENGITTWIKQPAIAPRLVHRPVEADGKTAVIAHNVVLIYNTESGELLWQYKLPFVANAAPAFDGRTLYIPDSADRVRAIELDTRQELWTCRAQNTINASPALLETLLVSTSESGEVLGYSTTSYEQAWPEHFRTRGPLRASPLLTYQGLCYVAGTDKMLYCLESGSGRELWRYFAGTSLSVTPTVADERVFLTVPQEGLRVLDARTGTLLNQFGFADGKQYLATINNRLYILTGDRQIIAVHPQTAEHLARASVKDFDFFLTNTQSPKIYAANTLGRIVCFQQLGVGPLHLNRAQAGK